MKKKSSKKNTWEDHFSKRAKKDGFPARSVYKLEEIQRKTQIIRKGDKVMDLGCSPGSWLIYASQLVGDKGHVVGIDIKPVDIALPPNTQVHIGDLLSIDETLTEHIGKDYNIVLSDMAPSTSGNKFLDAVRSYHLSHAALSLAKVVLSPGGSFVCKIFQGEDFETFMKEVQSIFKKMKIFKPQSSRKDSRETYIIGIGKK